MPDKVLHSRNPYHVDEGAPQLLPSVVVYMDVLGYTELAKRAERDGQQGLFLLHLHSALEEGQKWLSDESETWRLDKDRYALKAFTDNIVIGWPVLRGNTESALGSLFSMLAFFQMQMANHGFFLRGAISVGDAYVDDVVVYGSAFFEAHDGEVCLARDPRIILCASASSEVRKHLSYYSPAKRAPQNTDLYADSDGQWFLNYLETILIAENEQGPFYDQLLLHKENVEKRLHEFRSQPRIWSKYVWVANYHNYYCDQYPHYFDHSHKIDGGAYQLRLSRIVPDVV